LEKKRRSEERKRGAEGRWGKAGSTASPTYGFVIKVCFLCFAFRIAENTRFTGKFSTKYNITEFHV